MFCSGSLLTKSRGLSLSDQYWIRPDGSDYRWEDVNFYENGFSEDVGDMLFGSSVIRDCDFVSPDNTCNGVLKKRWKIIDGKRGPIKAGNELSQECCNEVIASVLCKAMDIPHADYRSDVHMNEASAFAETSRTFRRNTSTRPP